MQAPRWLSATAKDYWKKMYADVAPLTDGKAEVFALLCQCLSDYRQAIADNDTRQRKIMLDFCLKFAKEFHLTLRGSTSQNTSEELDGFVASE